MRDTEEKEELQAILRLEILGRLHQLNPNLTWADYLEMKPLGEIPYWVSDINVPVPKTETFEYKKNQKETYYRKKKRAGVTQQHVAKAIKNKQPISSYIRWGDGA